MEVVWLVEDLQESRRLAEEAKQVLAGAINHLGDRERIVMSLYYSRLSCAYRSLGTPRGRISSDVPQEEQKARLSVQSRW